MVIVTVERRADVPERDIERADDDVVLRFLDQIGDVARLITVAAEDGDTAALPTLYQQSGVVVTNALCARSDGFRPLVTPFFGADTPDGC